MYSPTFMMGKDCYENDPFSYVLNTEKMQFGHFARRLFRKKLKAILRMIDGVWQRIKAYDIFLPEEKRNKVFFVLPSSYSTLNSSIILFTKRKTSRFSHIIK